MQGIGGHVEGSRGPGVMGEGAFSESRAGWPRPIRKEASVLGSSGCFNKMP